MQSTSSSFCSQNTISNAYIHKKDSVSPTIVIFGHDKRTPDEQIAAKVFALIDKETIAKVRPYLSVNNRNFLDMYVRAMQGLLYECNVYSEITRLVEQRVTPNFITLKAVQRCDFNFIAAIVNKPVPFILDKIALTKAVGAAVMKKLPVQILITRRPTKSHTFEHFLVLQEIRYSDILDVIFQIIYTLKAMTLAGISHQDLHLFNILVEEFAVPTTFTYELDSQLFVITTKYVARIFDWDTAYVQKLGSNGFLSDRDCRKYGQCNKPNNKFDLFTFLCRLSMVCSEYSAKVPGPQSQVCRSFLLDVIKEPGVVDSDMLYENLKKYFYRNQQDKGFYCFLRENISTMKDHSSILKSSIFSHLAVATSHQQEPIDRSKNFYSLKNLTTQ